MKRKTACYCLAACINLFLFTYNVAAQTANPNEQVRFRLVRAYLIVVSVQINGAESFDFLLDTGLNTTMITPALAAQFNVRPVDRVELIGVTGTTVTPRAILPRLTLGPRSTENVETLINDLAVLRKLDSRICGVLGQNFLSRFNYLIDYRERRIQFIDTIESSLQGTRLPIENNEAALLLTVRSKKLGQTALKLLIDSATPGLIVFESGLSKLKDAMEPGESFVQIAGNVGKNMVRSGKLPRLWFGNDSFSDLPVIVMQSETTAQYRREDGLLPTILFRAIFFNNKDGYVVLNPQ